MAIRPAVTYTPYDTSSKEQTGDVITFAQFEEGNLLSDTHNDTESGDESKNIWKRTTKQKSSMTTLQVRKRYMTFVT